MTTTQPMPIPRAVIFDLDDTLVATAALWKEAESELLAAIGQRWEIDLSMRYKGMNALDVARVIHEHHQPAMPLSDCQHHMRSSLIRRFAQSPPPAMPGAVACVERARVRCELAVASGSPPEAIAIALRTLGIADLFSHVISSESVRAGKPKPDVYLLAAQHLGLVPEQCIAVEDSAIGAQAARSAGMNCWLIPSNEQARAFTSPGVFHAASLSQILI